ncbi:insulinoma-associated protein 1a-like [Lampetra fluviatilis]
MSTRDATTQRDSSLCSPPHALLQRHLHAPKVLGLNPQSVAYCEAIFFGGGGGRGGRVQQCLNLPLAVPCTNHVAKMPKGFLVKRSKRSSAMSYRPRAGEDNGLSPVMWLSPPDSTYPVNLGTTCTAVSPLPSSYPPPCSSAFSGRDQEPSVGFGSPDSGYASYSPTRAVSREDAVLGSPASAAPYPGQSVFPSLEQMLLAAPSALQPSNVELKPRSGLPSSSPTAGAKRPSPEPAERKSSKVAAKKPKAARRLIFEDNVTISPVLGLRIKEEPVDAKPRSSRPMGGGYVCQLCKEEYGDPFALAQHRCSRIVRVEYRCPECDKVFSCPANLASHRRWHKPRPSPASATPGGKADAEVPTAGATTTTAAAAAAAAGAAHSDGSSDREMPSRASTPSEAGSEDGPYECPRCSKKFRRRAYLRKHLQSVHEAAVVEAVTSSFPCQLCDEVFPVPEGREQHLLEHGLPRSGGVGSGGGGGIASAFTAQAAYVLDRDGATEQRLALHPRDLFPCKFCPATFYSSPGLTRHINKCHPSENRQVILLHMPLQPTC